MNLCVQGNCNSPEAGLLLIICGIAWTIAYVSAVRTGFRERTYAVPVVALALNFAWEVIYSAYRLSIDIASVYHWFNFLWAALDAVIIYTYFAFGRSEFPPCMSRFVFVLSSVFIFVGAFTLQAIAINEFGFNAAPTYTGFLQNALMSGLFIQMLISRRGTRGQNLTIAIGKCVGTFLPTIVVHSDRMLLSLGVVCFILDVIYIALIVWAGRRGGVLPKPVREYSVVEGMALDTV